MFAEENVWEHLLATLRGRVVDILTHPVDWSWSPSLPFWELFLPSVWLTLMFMIQSHKNAWNTHFKFFFPLDAGIYFSLLAMFNIHIADTHQKKTKKSSWRLTHQREPWCGCVQRPDHVHSWPGPVVCCILVSSEEETPQISTCTLM